MNTKTKAIALAISLLCTISALAQMRINVNDLPKSAQTFITKYYEKVKILRVEKDLDDGQVTYEVKLVGNTEVDFDSKGNWKEVSGKVPASIIPGPIAQSVKNDFKNKPIVKIERNYYGGYEIELSNGTDIHYNKSFKVLKVEK